MLHRRAPVRRGLRRHAARAHPAPGQQHTPRRCPGASLRLHTPANYRLRTLNTPPPHPAPPPRPLPRARTGTYDCAQGCPLSGVSGVCGANGVTFINDCLAECAGTAVAHQGPCLAPGRAAPGASAAAAASPAALAASPVGAFLSGAAAPGALAAAGGDVRVASLADMRRFEQEGLVLAGPARLADFQVSKPAASPNG